MTFPTDCYSQVMCIYCEESPTDSFEFLSRMKLSTGVNDPSSSVRLTQVDNPTGKSNIENLNYLAKLFSSDKFTSTGATTDEASVTSSDFKNPINFIANKIHISLQFV